MMLKVDFFLLILLKKMSNILLKNNNPSLIMWFLRHHINVITIANIMKYHIYINFELCCHRVYTAFSKQFNTVAY